MRHQRMNVVVFHGLREQPESALKIPFAGVVWPLLKTLVFVPTEGRDYVNKVYLREAIIEIKRRAFAKNPLARLIPLNWKTYTCDGGNVTAVSTENCWKPVADGTRFRASEIREFIQDVIARQRAAEWK